MKVLITGATGFVGSRVVGKLANHDSHTVRAAVRNDSKLLSKEVEQCVVGNLLNSTDYTQALANVDVVVHAAARVHMMDDTSADPLVEFRKVNVEGTLNLAKQAAQAGVKRFVFISSIGVNGNTNMKPFTESDASKPSEPYAISKHEAEEDLLSFSQTVGMEIVIIRPPLVYDMCAPGNFGKLVEWVKRSVPLPLGSVQNKRSFIALDNLVDFIILCVEHPKAANETFLISDGEDVSTTELLKKVGQALGKPARLIPVPVGVMHFAAKLIGKGDVAERLFGSLQVDSSKARNLLGWKPVVTMDEQLRKTVEAYKDETTV